MKITFVIGGARSGKSSFALNEAMNIDGRKAFIATAEAFDSEMKDRIEKHKSERGSEWASYEEPLAIASLMVDIKNNHDIIVLDCLTLWLSNVMMNSADRQSAPATVEESIRDLLKIMVDLRSGHQSREDGRRLFVVSNEVGMGIVPENKLARQFRDHAGKLNQLVAETADEVYLVTAGIPLRIKGK